MPAYRAADLTGQATLRQANVAMREVVNGLMDVLSTGCHRVDIAVPSFGDKNHIGIDRRHGLIHTWTATDAARHDGAQLDTSKNLAISRRL